MKKIFFCIIGLLLFGQAVHGQSITNFHDPVDQDDPYETRSYFMFGLNYVSNNVYLGRKDSMVIPYMSPYIGYHLKSGLYAKLLLSYSPAHKKGRIDLTTIEAGYDHSFSQHFNGGFSIDKFFYNKNTTSIRANTVGSAGIYCQYSNDWIEPQVNFDIDINKSSTDYVAGIFLDHNFSVANSTLNIYPTAGLNSGTQNYYDEYFKNRETKNNKKSKPQKVVGDAQQFKPLDYEFNCKVTYRVTKWLFTFIPTYAIPMSPSVITLPNRIVTEKLSNTFYVELDICRR